MKSLNDTLTREIIPMRYSLPVIVSIVASGIVTSAASYAIAEEAPVTAAHSAAAHPLRELDWLLGEWTGMTDNATVLISAHPCEGGAFVEREFVVKREGQPDVGGTQRIGYDPVSRRLKSWTFDSLGGFGEGYVERDGDSWVIESDETLADGAQSSTTAIITPKGDDRFEWEIDRARVNGHRLPKQKIEFVRAKTD
jgi:hypothetical protein